MLAQMVLSIKRSSFDGAIGAGAEVVMVEMISVRIASAAKCATWLVVIVASQRSKRHAHPFFQRNMQRPLVSLPVVFCLERFRAECALEFPERR
jgi:hypothetical protein